MARRWRLATFHHPRALLVVGTLSLAQTGSADVVQMSYGPPIWSGHEQCLAIWWSVIVAMVVRVIAALKPAPKSADVSASEQVEQEQVEQFRLSNAAEWVDADPDVVPHRLLEHALGKAERYRRMKADHGLCVGDTVLWTEISQHAKGTLFRVIGCGSRSTVSSPDIGGEFRRDDEDDEDCSPVLMAHGGAAGRTFATRGLAAQLHKVVWAGEAADVVAGLPAELQAELYLLSHPQIVARATPEMTAVLGEMSRTLSNIEGKETVDLSGILENLEKMRSQAVGAISAEIAAARTSRPSGRGISHTLYDRPSSPMRRVQLEVRTEHVPAEVLLTIEAEERKAMDCLEAEYGKKVAEARRALEEAQQIAAQAKETVAEARETANKAWELAVVPIVCVVARICAEPTQVASPQHVAKVESMLVQVKQHDADVESRLAEVKGCESVVESLLAEKTEKLQAVRDEAYRKRWTAAEQSMSTPQEGIPTVQNWSKQQVATWLRDALKLESVADMALAAEVDGPTAVEMDKEGWKELGASAVQAAKIVAQLKKHV